MYPSRKKPWGHKRSSSTSNVHAYDDDDFYDNLRSQPSSSAPSPAQKLVTSVKRSLSQSRTRKRDMESQIPPLSPSPYASSPSRYRYHDPSTMPSDAPPTLEQIAMGLHISRTPHLRTMTVGVRGRAGPAAGRPPSAKAEVAQVYYSPYLSHSNGSTLATSSRSHSRSSSRAHSHMYPDPRLAPKPSTPPPPVPPSPQRSVSLPSAPLRSSLKRASQTSPPSSLSNPGLSSAAGSVASTSTDSSLSTTKSSVRGRSLLNLSLKGRMGWLLGAKLARDKGNVLEPAYEEVVEVAAAKKAVRFDDRRSITESHEGADEATNALN